jgi:hypothetical protein
VDAEPSPESVAATDRGHALVDRARKSGKWTADDAAALRALLPAITDDQREELFAILFPALNRGEIVADFRGPVI